MTESTYHVIELIGSSSDSWELAAQNAVREAAKAYNDLRVAEVVEMDVLIEEGKVLAEGPPEVSARNSSTSRRCG